MPRRSTCAPRPRPRRPPMRAAAAREHEAIEAARQRPADLRCGPLAACRRRAPRGRDRLPPFGPAGGPRPPLGQRGGGAGAPRGCRGRPCDPGAGAGPRRPSPRRARPGSPRSAPSLREARGRPPGPGARGRPAPAPARCDRGRDRHLGRAGRARDQGRRRSRPSAWSAPAASTPPLRRRRTPTSPAAAP